ncbi:Sugar transporter ERD6-like 6 [Oopsacas minuta]|uniref:Sugar transporter ERD6-like 6 n=1 Tax=Oopsacas minuta TaxID=111878 RepID=A0AAV7JXX3_9METZ|nr:Sugar transporter ERD6-like 6 [Oopsacas minuta]
MKVPSNKSIRVFHCCMVISLGYVGCVYIDGYSSPIEDELLKARIFTENVYPVFVSISFLTAMISSFISGPLSEWLGCKAVIILFSPFAIIGGFLLVLAHDSNSMILGKMMVGINQGMVITCVPIFNAEIPPPHMRQFYGSMLAIAVRFGVPLTYFLGIWVGASWLALGYVGISSFIVLNVVFLPESPKWLQKKGFTEKAERARNYYYNSLQNEECQKITENLNVELWVPAGASIKEKISSYFVWPVIRPMLVCSSIHLFKTSSSYELLLSFGSHTIERGVNINPNIASLFYGIFLLSGSILFLLIYSKVNWKRWILVTTMIQAISNGLLALVMFLSINIFHCSTTETSILCDILQYSPMILVSSYAFTMAAGWGSLSYWLLGEILHHHYARVSAGIVIFVSYMSAYLNELIAPMIVEYLGPAVVFLGYAIMCLIGFTVQWFY